MTSKQSIEEGDYLTASWGYDQTNASFWVVTKRTPKTVDLLAVRGRFYGDTRRLEPSDVPVTEHDWEVCEIPDGLSVLEQRVWHEDHTDCFVERRYRRKVQPAHGNAAETVRITSYMWASIYEGGGEYDTIAAGEPGH